MSVRCVSARFASQTCHRGPAGQRASGPAVRGSPARPSTACMSTHMPMHMPMQTIYACLHTCPLHMSVHMSTHIPIHVSIYTESHLRDHRKLAGGLKICAKALLQQLHLYAHVCLHVYTLIGAMALLRQLRLCAVVKPCARRDCGNAHERTCAFRCGNAHTPSAHMLMCRSMRRSTSKCMCTCMWNPWSGKTCHAKTSSSADEAANFREVRNQLRKNPCT